MKSIIFYRMEIMVLINGVIDEYDYSKNEEVRPGIHNYAQSIVNDKFPKNERTIVGIFKRQWYVTKADTISIGSSEYRYFLIKAPNNLANQFNIDLEIVVIFSSYPNFEPRTLDAFEYVKRKLERGRIENLCGVLISNQDNIDSQIQKQNSGEKRIIVPFSYTELTNKANSEDYFIRQRFQKFFYNRDLFEDNILRKYTIKKNSQAEFGLSQKNPAETNYYEDLDSFDWYAYDDNFCTDEEKLLVRLLKNLMTELEEKWTDIYLLRNEKAVRIYSFDKGKSFEPDFLMVANDKKTGNVSCMFS